MKVNDDNEKIGQYLSKLIDKRYKSKRQFCKAYIETRGEEADDEEIRKMANRISQIIKGNKSIQIYDLPIFTKLLEVSCEEILSAGKRLSFVSEKNHITNYDIAFERNKDIWEQYINMDDKIILNSDEYGKTVIDYALQFKNYEFLKYLMEKKYIWFVNPDHEQWIFNFGAGTSIERRKLENTDSPDYIAENGKLRMQLIFLAIKHDNTVVLDQLHARENPSLYEWNYYSYKDVECDIDYKEDMIIYIAKASPKILNYFAKEFKIKDKNGQINTFVFPYMTNLLDLLIKENHAYAEKILKISIEHNRNVYHKLEKAVKSSIKILIQKDMEYLECIKYSEPKEFIEHHRKEFIDGVTKRVREQINFYENGSIVYFFDIFTLDKVISNIVCVNGVSNENRINSLIQELNDLYNKIRGIEP